MLNEVIKMAWGKVKLDSVITKSLGKMDQERSFVLRPFPHGLLYFVQKSQNTITKCGSSFKKRKSRVVCRTEMERLGFIVTVPWKGITGVIPSSCAHRNRKRNYHQFLFPWIYKLEKQNTNLKINRDPKLNKISRNMKQGQTPLQHI